MTERQPRGNPSEHPAPVPERLVVDAGQERLAGLVATLEQGIERILGSEGFAAYLRVMARFPTYSATNAALILVQRPEATRVAGYRAWQALDRQVRKGERGIKIFVPYRRRALVAHETTEDGEDEHTHGQPQGPGMERVSGFGVGTVFDVAQTEGEPLPASPTIQELDGTSEIGEAIDRRLSRFLLDEGLRLTTEDTGRARGYYAPEGRLIALSDRLTGDQQAKTLTHEAAHYLADHRGRIDRDDAETVAESSAFVVLAHFGIDTGGYTFPYVATWAKDKAVLRRNLAEVQQVASRLIGAIEGTPVEGEETP